MPVAARHPAPAKCPRWLTAEKSPAEETVQHVPAPAKCPRWLTAEKSPAEETTQHVPAPAKCPRWLTAEKSPVGETETTVRGDTPNTRPWRITAALAFFRRVIAFFLIYDYLFGRGYALDMRFRRVAIEFPIHV